MSMSILPAIGEAQSFTLETINFDVSGAVSLRLGNTPEEMSLAEWLPYCDTVEWWGRGDTNPGPFTVYAEATLSDGSVLSLSATEPNRLSGPVTFAADDPFCDTFGGGFENWASYGYLYFPQPDGTLGKADLGIGHEEHANTFFPVSVKSDGTVWVDDSRWTLDTPEVVNGAVDVLPALTYAHWKTNGASDTVDLSGGVIMSADLFCADLDLKGGSVDFWVTTDLGRWHFGPELRDGHNAFELRVDGATQSWSRSGTALGVEALDLAHVQSWGFGFNSFSAEPTGVFGFDNVAFGFEDIGNASDDQIVGDSGDDKVYGLAGDDMLWGKDGDDLMIGGTGADVLTGGIGTDAAAYHNSDSAVRVVLDGVSRYGDADGDIYGSIENVIASPFNDEVFGDNGNNEIWGQGGDDDLLGATGNDILHGGDGNDRLWGEAGNDVLRGDAGTDYLVGGAGADTFFFAAVSDSPPDTIVDFNDAEGDVIDISMLAPRDVWQDNVTHLLNVDTDGDHLADFAIQLDHQIDLTHVLLVHQ